MLRLMGTTMVGLAVVTSLGCGGSKSGLATVPVSGIVTLDGAPLEGAMVTFVPGGEKGSRQASGTTDTAGRYSLTTLDPNDGALVGSYSVKVSKAEVKSAMDGIIKEGMSPEEMMKAAYSSQAYKSQKGPQSAKKQKADVKDFVPAKYQDPAKSGLKADVAKGAKNEFNFDLTSK